MSVQPRIRLTRSFDQRSHNYLGYVLSLEGAVGAESRAFFVAVGNAAHAKHGLQRGDRVSGEGVPVADRRLETAELYKVSKLRVLERARTGVATPPPWHGVPPNLDVYRRRGRRRLAARTYQTRCKSCIWGAHMPVEIIVDQWNPRQRRYRTETFCYGPLSCPLYKAGPKRQVPGRRGMTYTEEDWVDDMEVEHRNADE